MMYTIANNYVFNINEQFRDIGKEKIAIFFSGGMESTLASKIALDVYGRDRCVFVYCDFRGTRTDPKHYFITSNVDRGASMLGINVHYVEIDHSLYETDRCRSLIKLTNDIIEKYGVTYFMYGFTKLFFDVEVISRCEIQTTLAVKKLLLSSPHHYKQMINEFHVHQTNDYIDALIDKVVPPMTVYDLMNEPLHQHHFIYPFRPIYKYQVLDLYHKMNLVDLMDNTFSCISSVATDENKHCGHCMNCQQRHDAHAILGIDDPTVYKYNTVIQRRKNTNAYMRANC